MTTMTYNGYQALVEFDETAEIFHGEVIGLRDVITFQGKSAAELKKAFKGSVEDYLDFCKTRGEEPERPFSGQFLVRTSPAAHRQAVLAAKMRGVSLNTWLNDIIQSSASAQVARTAPNGQLVTAGATMRRKNASGTVLKRSRKQAKHG